MPTKPRTAKKTPPAAKKTATAKKVGLGAFAPGGSTTPGASSPPLPPTPAVPAVPPSFTPLDHAQSVRLSRPAPVQVASGAAVAAEIVASKTYAQDFSANAPAATELAALLNAAEAWTTAEAEVAAYAQYVSTQRQLAWAAALGTAEALEVEYLYALAHDKTIAARYPELTRFLNAKKAQAQHAAATRKKAKKKAKKTPPAT